MGKHCNSYGFNGTFAAITAAIAWVLVKSADEKCFLNNLSELNNYHTICIIGGVVIGILSLFAIGNTLYEIRPVCNLIVALGIAALGGLAAYTAYLAYQRPCTATGIFGIRSLDQNVFTESDGKMIGVFILDIATALLFFGSAGSFAKNV